MTTGGFLLLILLAIAVLMAWKLARGWRGRASERHGRRESFGMPGLHSPRKHSGRGSLSG